MMGKQPPLQTDLFCYTPNLEERIPANHPLRRIKSLVDFNFVSEKVQSLYGTKGNVSVPPPVILKFMFLLFYYDVASERELMESATYRMDWLWFLDYRLEGKIPDHSVLSKARARWGAEAFEEFFHRIVWQCVEAGLVDGGKIFCDSSLVDADASGNSVVDREKFSWYASKKYRELEDRLDECDDQRRYVSTTDPDASVVTKSRKKSRPCYAEHRAVDSKKGVITATETTPGAVNEAHKLTDLLDGHQKSTRSKAEVVVADSKYGTVENFLKLHDRGVKGHIPDLSASQWKAGQHSGIFDISEFIYDEETDAYLCPAGQRLRPRKHKKKQKAIEYSAKRKICQACELKDKCTRSRSGVRSIKRHVRQQDLDRMRRFSKSVQSRRDLRTRKHFMERSYADAANNHGFKRSRWRGLDRITIQDLIIAAVQNIRILIKYGRTPSGVALEMRMGGQNVAFLTAHLYQSLCYTMESFRRVIRLSYN